MKYRANISVLLKSEIPDVNGRAITKLLTNQGYSVTNARFGKSIEIIFEQEPYLAHACVRDMGTTLLAHPVTEVFSTVIYSRPNDKAKWLKVAEPLEVDVVPDLVEVALQVQSFDMEPYQIDCEGRKVLRVSWWTPDSKMMCVMLSGGYAIRMDIDKIAFLDDLPDAIQDRALKNNARKIWSLGLSGLTHAPLPDGWVPYSAPFSPPWNR
jgi:phosphoribosylformylglycinamidine (FGAM) synthase PurS component